MSENSNEDVSPVEPAEVVTETVETTETVVEKPVLDDPAEELRTELPEPVETTTTETVTETTVDGSDSA